jgi:putative drug exporter of the RND superfamily
VKDANFAGRAGRWSAAHWKTAAFGWIAFAVLAVALGRFVGTNQMESWAVANGESRRAAQILDQANFDLRARESVLVQSRTSTIDEQAFSSAVAGVVQTLSLQPNVTNVVSRSTGPMRGSSRPIATRRSSSSTSREKPRRRRT